MYGQVEPHDVYRRYLWTEYERTATYCSATWCRTEPVRRSARRGTFGHSHHVPRNRRNVAGQPPGLYTGGSPPPRPEHHHNEASPIRRSAYNRNACICHHDPRLDCVARSSPRLYNDYVNRNPDTSPIHDVRDACRSSILQITIHRQISAQPLAAFVT